MSHTNSTMVQAPYLHPGDRIHITATARAIQLEELQAAIQFLEGEGFRVTWDDTIGAIDHQFAGSDELRRRCLQAALDDKDIKAILCARGGYGTVRILDQLEFTRFTNHPKWIVGYSDITYLLAHINHKLKIQTLHATMPISFPTNTRESWESLVAALTGKKMQLTAASHPLNREGQANAVIVGGNLSILYSITGCHSGLDTHGKILFLEDLDEYLYHIDRMLYNLDRSGKLAGLKGMLIGGMTDMNDNAIPFGQSAEEIIAQHVAQYDFPVAFNVPVGHGPDNRALRFGAPVTMKVDQSGTTVEG